MPRKPYEADDQFPGQRPDSLAKMQSHGVIGGRPKPPRPPLQPPDKD
jgi:hypothetical protein